MKVSVDFDVCASTGACMQVCPEVFEVRSDGYLYILQENPGPELAQKVNEAADLCPTAAITSSPGSRCTTMAAKWWARAMARTMR